MRQSGYTRLKWIAHETRDSVDPSTISDESVFHYSIPALDEFGDGKFDAPADIESTKLVLSGGEVLVSKLNPRKSRVLIAAGHDVPTVASTEFVALQPAPGLDARFLSYWLQGEATRQMLDGATMSVTRSQQRVRPEVLLNSFVDLPAIEFQRVIADYLDCETARIDALIAAKRRMVALLIEAEQRLLVDQVGDWRSTDVWSLRQARTEVITGPFGTQLRAGEYINDGVPVINPTHVTRTGDIAADPRVSVTEDVANRLKRHRVAVGDILLGRKGDVGRSAIVGVDQAGWLCGSDAIAVRTDPRFLDARFLVVLLQADLYRQQLHARSTGAMVASVNEDTLLGFCVPRISLARQRVVVKGVQKAMSRRRAAIDRISASTALLEEHRKAMISAAVAGQLEIPGAV